MFKMIPSFWKKKKKKTSVTKPSFAIQSKSNLKLNLIGVDLVRITRSIRSKFNLI
jgi:hypothetical protein